MPLNNQPETKEKGDRSKKQGARSKKAEVGGQESETGDGSWQAASFAIRAGGR